MSHYACLTFFIFFVYVSTLFFKFCFIFWCWPGWPMIIIFLYLYANTHLSINKNWIRMHTKFSNPEILSFIFIYVCLQVSALVNATATEVRENTGSPKARDTDYWELPYVGPRSSIRHWSWYSAITVPLLNHWAISPVLNPHICLI